MRAALLAFLPLIGCAPQPAWRDAAEQALADGRASLVALGAPPTAAPAPAAPAPQPTSPAPAASTNSPPPANLPPATGALHGHSPREVTALLGEPAFRREEGPASIWLFSGQGCLLDVLFYAGPQGPRVAHAQARARGVAPQTEAACLRDLASTARRPSRQSQRTLEPVA